MCKNEQPKVPPLVGHFCTKMEVQRGPDFRSNDHSEEHSEKPQEVLRTGPDRPLPGHLATPNLLRRASPTGFAGRPAFGLQKRRGGRDAFGSPSHPFLGFASLCLFCGEGDPSPSPLPPQSGGGGSPPLKGESPTTPLLRRSLRGGRVPLSDPEDLTPTLHDGGPDGD